MVIMLVVMMLVTTVAVVMFGNTFMGHSLCPALC